MAAFLDLIRTKYDIQSEPEPTHERIYIAVSRRPALCELQVASLEGTRLAHAGDVSGIT
jgi:hypothetical protein